ncbi:MAG: prenyltransferase [Alphaproteobacteria bacterium]
MSAAHLYVSRGFFPADYFQPTVDYILSVQDREGAIPWFAGGELDPWDHVESAMGLSIGGRHQDAVRAYRWLAARQDADGAWWPFYRDGAPVTTDRRESHMAAYAAVGVWHHYLISGEREFLAEMWPMVRAGIDFALKMQSPAGDIAWARHLKGGEDIAWDDALITGCSSIYKSLECAINIAQTLGHGVAAWRTGRAALGQALRERPERFDRKWPSHDGFSMDWYYPVLAGAVGGERARAHLAARWQTFVIEGMGCRCQDHRKWVTVAESCELVLALLAAGDYSRAGEMFSWLHQWRAADGAYWTGYVCDESEIWPVEKPTWTASAVLLAADALTQATPACRLFTENSVPEAAQEAEAADHRQSLE